MKLTTKKLNTTTYLSDIYGEVRDLIEIRDGAEVFAREVAEYLCEPCRPLSEQERYLLEKARKLGGLK
jgi:hypothetical protein